MKTIFVRPSPGIEVRDPLTRQLMPASGCDVEDNAFWRRRLAAGHVLLVREETAECMSPP